MGRGQCRYGESTEAAGLTLDDIDYIELNEAFAAQSWPSSTR